MRYTLTQWERIRQAIQNERDRIEQEAARERNSGNQGIAEMHKLQADELTVILEKFDGFTMG